MQWIFTAKELRTGFTLVERCVGRSAQLPVLSCIKITVEGGKSTISATNLEQGIVVNVPLKDGEDGTCVLPARLLGQYVSHVPVDANVVITMEGGSVTVKSGRFVATIKVCDAAQFPPIPKLPDGKTLLTLSAPVVKRITERTAFAVSRSTTRLELTGVRWHFDETALRCAATDVFRLAEVIVPLGTKEKGQEYDTLRSEYSAVTIPQQTLVECVRLADAGGGVEVVVYDRQIFFRSESGYLVSRTIDGQFPDYRAILSQKTPIHIVVPREELIKAVQMATFFGAKDSPEVTCTLQGAERIFRIHAQSQEFGENTTDIPLVECDGADLTLTFTPRFLLEGLGAIETPTVSIGLTAPTAPAVMHGWDTENAKIFDNFTYFLMPLRK